jgi:hypothetical protein
VVTVDDVRAVAAELPRSYEVVVRGRIKLRVKQIVYLAFSKDETEVGFGFPKSEREYLVASRPNTFFLPDEFNMRFHWVEAWTARLEPDEMRDFVICAWAMCVPKYVSAPYVLPD